MIRPVCPPYRMPTRACSLSSVAAAGKNRALGGHDAYLACDFARPPCTRVCRDARELAALGTNARLQEPAARKRPTMHLFLLLEMLADVHVEPQHYACLHLSRIGSSRRWQNQLTFTLTCALMLIARGLREGWGVGSTSPSAHAGHWSTHLTSTRRFLPSVILNFVQPSSCWVHTFLSFALHLSSFALVSVGLTGFAPCGVHPCSVV